jgi:hypothetical protein
MTELSVAGFPGRPPGGWEAAWSYSPSCQRMLCRSGSPNASPSHSGVGGPRAATRRRRAVRRGLLPRPDRPPGRPSLAVPVICDNRMTFLRSRITVPHHAMNTSERASPETVPAGPATSRFWVDHNGLGKQDHLGVSAPGPEFDHDQGQILGESFQRGPVPAGGAFHAGHAAAGM